MTHLLRSGAKTSQMDQKGYTALHYAAAKGHKLVIQQLMDRLPEEFEAGNTDAPRTTPLHLAVSLERFSLLSVRSDVIWGIPFSPPRPTMATLRLWMSFCTATRTKLITRTQRAGHPWTWLPFRVTGTLSPSSWTAGPVRWYMMLP